MAVRVAHRKTADRAGDKASYHHGDLRRALLDASLALIAEEGSSALSLREVARRAGVTHAAPYRHFVDKEALLAAVAEEGHRAMAERMRETMARATTPLDRLEACGVAYVLFTVEHPAHFRVMFGPHFTRPVVAADSPDPVNSFRLLLDTIVEAQRAGQLRAEPPATLALTCWSLVHGLASLWVDRQLGAQEPGPGLEGIARQQTRLLLQGLALPPRG